MTHLMLSALLLVIISFHSILSAPVKGKHAAPLQQSGTEMARLHHALDLDVSSPFPQHRPTSLWISQHWKPADNVSVKRLNPTHVKSSNEESKATLKHQSSNRNLSTSSISNALSSLPFHFVASSSPRTETERQERLMTLAIRPNHDGYLPRPHNEESNEQIIDQVDLADILHHL